ncbi:hypothetical protein COLO4_37615 [Corchorus olitorius]|uniref:Uncharacterized protein n=1 Tax=Corchorus olitorius TaxID=93759 RepID=A0A1R3G0E0_9ROSI|nr:hypothetical protein COLO4_37615 [Corchorus olitorius]
MPTWTKGWALFLLARPDEIASPWTIDINQGKILLLSLCLAERNLGVAYCHSCLLLFCILAGIICNVMEMESINAYIREYELCPVVYMVNA